MEEASQPGKYKNFIKRHPILFNLLLMFIAGCGVVWITLVALDVWTGHGKYEVVPNMRGLTYNQASAALAAAGLDIRRAHAAGHRS